MPRTCTICNHPERDQIEEAILANEPLRRIVARYGTSTGSLQRHKSGCVPNTLATAHDTSEIVRGHGLLERIAVLEGDARRFQKAAEKAKDLRTALLATRELLRIVGMLATIRPPEPQESIPLIEIRMVSPGDVGSAPCPLPIEERGSGRGGAGIK
jgi:hypothetical protein